MRALEIIIRVIFGIVLVLSVTIVAILVSIRVQRDALPSLFGFYVELMEDSAMTPAAPDGALIILKEADQYVPGDIVAYLNDDNMAETGRIKSIDGKTEDVSVSVPYEEMSNELGNISFSLESVMDYDPDVVIAQESGDLETTVPADRLMAKAVFISGAMGVIVSMYRNNIWAFLMIFSAAIICIWPFRFRRGEPKYKEDDLDGPWVG